MKIIKRKSKIFKRPQFDFSKLSSASFKFESCDRDQFFSSRNGNMKIACFTVFHFAVLFYRFFYHIISLNTRISKLLIFLFPLFFNFRPISHPRTLSFQCSQSHLQISSSQISCPQRDTNFLTCFVIHKRDQRAKIFLFQYLFKNVEFAAVTWTRIAMPCFYLEIENVQ